MVGMTRAEASGTGTRVFVYGTLRRGEVNHHLLASARFVGEARTVPSYTLFALDGHPGMGEGGCTRVVGECYDVNNETLAALDQLEGYPGWYERVPVALEQGDHALAYLLPPRFTADRPVIAEGDWVRWVRSR
jgi:gamma-glutamylaminecyclotransferase